MGKSRVASVVKLPSGSLMDRLVPSMAQEFASGASSSVSGSGVRRA